MENQEQFYTNIFYFDRINKIGGVETFFYEIAKKYCNNDITVFYSFGDLKQIQRLNKMWQKTRYLDGVFQVLFHQK